MIKSIRFLSTAALLASVGAAHAITPSLGIWWNPDESGRGYEIDRQGGTMTLAMYAYDATGKSIWYLGAGDFTAGSDQLVIDAFSYSGGQCFGCAFSSPLGIEFGEVSIQFSDSDHGVLNFPGGSVPIEHFNYGYASKQDQLLGYWSFSAAIADGENGYGPQTLGEFLQFDAHYTAADGTTYVSGTSFVDSSVTALGSYSEADDIYTVDVTLPDGTIHHYELQGSDNVLIGLSNYGVQGTSTSAIATRVEYYAPTLQGQPNAAASFNPLRSAHR